MKKFDYINKIQDILNDQSIYCKQTYDNTKVIANKLIVKLKTFKDQGFIDYREYNSLYPRDFEIPSVYALIKIHKPGNPARLICPYFNHPLSKLSGYLSKLITPLLRNCEYTLRDSSQFIQDIKKIKISRNDTMFSLDVVNLFTNIPVDYTIKVIEQKILSNNNFNPRIPKNEIIKLIEFCLKSTSFAFNGDIYFQKSGAPMGCNLSPIIAEALVAHIFEQAVKEFEIKPKFIRFYVDDSFLIMNSRYVDNFFDKINSIGSNLGNIKFTIEREFNNEISFLDIKVIKHNNSISTMVFRKPTHSNRYLNFNSNHSLQNKISVIRTLVNRAFTHTSDKVNLDRELSSIKQVLIENYYPPRLIENIISECKHKFNTTSPLLNTNFDMTKVVSTPYNKGLGENIKKTLGQYGINVVFKKIY